MSIKALCIGGRYLVRARPLPALVNSSVFQQSQQSFSVSSINMAEQTDYKNATSIYDFTVKDTFGKDVSLDKYKGNVVVIVNTASQCGLTKSNYESLTKLKKEYEDSGVKILAFPCNQFANEAPEQDGEEMVCHLQKANADIGDVFKKVDVNGDNAAPLYKYLKKEQGGILGNGIKWNFTKFLVDKEGHPVERFAPTTSISSVKSKIDELLKK